MAMFSWRVVPDDGEPYVVEAGTRDVLAWEKAKSGRSAQQLQDNFQVANAYWLAHRAATRAGMFAGNLKDFEESVDLETAVLVPVESDDEDGTDPTHPAP